MISGSCHCGQIAFQVDGEIPAKLTRCTCSFCAKRGMLHAYYTPDKLARGLQARLAYHTWREHRLHPCFPTPRPNVSTAVPKHQAFSIAR